jgi:hypothetical protein
MKIKNIFRNLTDYFEGNLVNKEINGVVYRISQRFIEKDPSVLIALTFGLGVDEESYNQKIAKFARDARGFFKRSTPIYAQAEVGHCLGGIENVFSFGRYFGGDTQTSLFLPKYTTYESMNQMAEEMKADGLDKSNACFIAHPAHEYRVIEIGKKVGLEGGIFTPNEVEWAAHDPQVFVRRVKYWIPREIGARIHHKIKKQL